MALYDTTSYSPRIRHAGSWFYFHPTDESPPAVSDDGQINIVDISVDQVTRNDEITIPGQDGMVGIGSDRSGLVIRIDIEIASTSLEVINDRARALDNALKGDADRKFDLYLRYEDADNYYAYPNCLLRSHTLPVGPQYTKDVTPRNTGTLSIVSEAAEPTIVSGGTVESGSAVTTISDAHYFGATTIWIEEELLIQNGNGDVLASISVADGKLTLIGTVEQSL